MKSPTSRALSDSSRPSPISSIPGIYIHWPFCARKCPYCDFYTFGREHGNFELSQKYTDALVAEIEYANRTFALTEKPRVDTIYFGGGTPSLAGETAIREILAALRGAFEVDPVAEITMEVNPTAAEAAELEAYRDLGINRLSIGCQSFQDKFLQTLGRDHDAKTARSVLELVKNLGLDNFSIDLMFGLPGQTLPEFEADLEATLEFQPAHLSAYGLTFHEGTPFARWKAERKWSLPGEDQEASMFEHMIDRLAGAGFEQYEISNWARPGFASRHNSKYWRQCDVFAFGASAHGTVGGDRTSNPRGLPTYIETLGGSEGANRVEEPKPESDRAVAAEVMMLALRRIDGVDWSELETWMERDPQVFYRTELNDLQSQGLLEFDAQCLRLTRRGILLADHVIERFF